MNIKEENIEKEKDLEKVFELLKKGMDILKTKEKVLLGDKPTESEFKKIKSIVLK